MLSGAGHRWYVSFCCLSAVSRFAFVIALLLFVSGQPLRICHLFAALTLCSCQRSADLSNVLRLSAAFVHALAAAHMCSCVFM